MRFFSFKIIALCILLPPVFYIVTLLAAEERIKQIYTDEIEKSYTGDTRELFSGNVQIREVIARNVDNFLHMRRLISWGVKVIVTVTTRGGTLLYPLVFETSSNQMSLPDPLTVAADNYAIMSEGLTVNVDVEIDHNTLLSNLILGGYICMFLFITSVYYRTGIRKSKRLEEEKNREIERLVDLKKTYIAQLDELARNREDLQVKYEGLRHELENEKIRAMKNEDELINEIVNSEAQIEKNLLLQKEQNEEIETLKEIIKELEKGVQRDGKQIVKSTETVGKRFKALYKNIIMHKRAIEGYLDLSDDMKIKSEEIIHQLNDDAAKVAIKRKVFHKKSRETVLEVIYGYRGRLYFRRTKDNKIEILSVGTKNTQTRDLEFLDNL